MTATDDGARLGDELARIGYAGPLPCPAAAAPHAYVELHIEQGPILEDEGITIGVVEGVQGISWTELTITGRSAHAGTTPMRLRRDPWICRGGDHDVRAVSSPSASAPPRSAPSGVSTCVRTSSTSSRATATITVDLRNTDEEVLVAAERALAAEVDRLAAAEQVTVSTRSLARFQPVEFDPATVDLVEATARRLGYSTRRLPSGAGHDAQMLARDLPSSDDLHPERRTGCRTTSPSTPRPTTSPPAPTCCCRRSSTSPRSTTGHRPARTLLTNLAAMADESNPHGTPNIPGERSWTPPPPPPTSAQPTAPAVDSPGASKASVIDGPMRRAA